MSYFKVCSRCGAHLDPGEQCDCQWKEKAAISTRNTDSGRVEQNITAVSTSSIQ